MTQDEIFTALRNHTKYTTRDIVAMVQQIDPDRAWWAQIEFEHWLPLDLYAYLSMRQQDVR